MELLREWAMTVAGIVVFGAVCESVLPEGAFQKYVRLAIGLVLVVAMVRPLTQAIRTDATADFGISEQTASYEDVYEQAEQKQKQDVSLVYRANLEATMQEVLAKELNGRWAKVTCTIEQQEEQTFGTVRQVLVILLADGNNITETVTERLQQEFGIQRDRIVVRYLEDTEE